jgi:hypothetical protein
VEFFVMTTYARHKARAASRSPRSRSARSIGDIPPLSGKPDPMLTLHGRPFLTLSQLEWLAGQNLDRETLLRMARAKK